MNTEPLAWEVEINSLLLIVFAPTKPKARWIAVRSYREAGYGREGVWPPVTAKRVPSLDKSSLRHRAQKAWAPEYARYAHEMPIDDATP